MAKGGSGRARGTRERHRRGHSPEGKQTRLVYGTPSTAAKGGSGKAHETPGWFLWRTQADERGGRAAEVPTAKATKYHPGMA